MKTGSSITTILFTDLVSSTELIRRLGDDGAQRIFERHHAILSDLLSEGGGEELQWLGDGLMAAFSSTAEAVRCAVAMQSSTLQSVSGERLAIRIGLNVGEILQQDTGSGYFGTPLVVARRLCDSAASGQILASNVVSGLLAGRQAFRFRDLGLLELKGIGDRVGACEVLYETEQPAAAFARTPFVGREAELEQLLRAVERAKNGHGGLVMVVGEPGIGKTRTIEEASSRARNAGFRLLWGRCYEGEGSPPYGPFAEILAEVSKEADSAELRKDLGSYGIVMARIAPGLRDRLPDVPEPPALQPDEERYRLLDAVAQYLTVVSRRTPLLLVLDDLHWADGGTIVLLRHLGRLAQSSAILIVGAYRDVELDRSHLLGEALSVLRRETDYERVVLKGLDQRHVGELLETIAAREVPEAFRNAIAEETEGNPFFIREILLHLVEAGKLHHQDGRWTSRYSVEEMGIPEGVRQVIGRRLSRLSPDANQLLAAAAGFQGAFRFDLATAVAGLDEKAALDALDEALDAHLLRAGPTPEAYDFTHALIRHTLYAEMNPSRQVRLHRRIAEEMERAYGDGATEHAGEIAREYHRSATLPGAAKGVPMCLAAAERAEAGAAHEEVAVFLRMALELLPESDSRRARILGRVGLALAWSQQLDEAVTVAERAADEIARTEGTDAAAEYLADAADAIWLGSFHRLAWRLAQKGLRFVGSRDIVWARLAIHDLTRREALDPNHPGIPIDTPERHELFEVICRNLGRTALGATTSDWMCASFSSRADVLERAGQHPSFLMFWAGEFRAALVLFEAFGEQCIQVGQLALAAISLTVAARAHYAIGEIELADRIRARAVEIATRLPRMPVLEVMMAAMHDFRSVYRGEEIEQSLARTLTLATESAIENQWVISPLHGVSVLLCGFLGKVEQALSLLEKALPAIERAPGSAANYTLMIDCACGGLWYLGRADHVVVIERNLREKTLGPDFRYEHCDARLAMARLCALQARWDDAADWFARARAVLEEQGARPLRAITDLDEALMYIRRQAPGDRERAAKLLGLAIAQFNKIGMPGWTRRAEELLRECRK
jgi:class 3 adenylate cyclase/tetratricopeptide (TPR) repeat protein